MLSTRCYWLKCLAGLALLAIVSGCSSSTSKSPSAARQDTKPKPLGNGTPTGSFLAGKPGFPLAGPPNLTPASPPQPPSSTAVSPVPPATHNTRPVGPYGVRQITLGLNDLRQAGLLLVNYYNENNSWPRNDAELRDALREMPTVYKAIQLGDYILVPLKNPQLVPGAQTVLIYERLPDKAGIRLVLFGDGSVKRVNQAEFQQLKLPPP